MSEQAPKGFYVYQPKPPQPDGRIYAIGGLPWGARFDGLTREEADRFCAALNLIADSGKMVPPETGVSLERQIAAVTVVVDMAGGEYRASEMEAALETLRWVQSQRSGVKV